MYHTKKIMKNVFWIFKVRNESVIRLRISGGDLDVRYLDIIKKLAEKFGNGTVHLTTRQGFEIPGIKLSQLEEIKKFMAEFVDGIE